MTVKSNGHAKVVKIPLVGAAATVPPLWLADGPDSMVSTIAGEADLFQRHPFNERITLLAQLRFGCVRGLAVYAAVTVSSHSLASCSCSKERHSMPAGAADWM